MADEANSNPVSEDEGNLSGQEEGDVERNVFDLEGLTDDVKVIDLVHARADHIPNFENLKDLETLCMRNNLLSSITPTVSKLTTLTTLDLYENQLTEIANLEPLVNLVELDLSYNRLREIKGVSTLVKLEKIYLVHNKITKIENLEKLVNLTLLELGDNRIKVIENIDTLVNLEELYLGKNKIKKLEGLDTLTKLRLFSIPGNRLVKFDNLSCLTSLEELYASDQGIQNLEGIEEVPWLKTLDVSNNELTTFSNIDALKLRDLWANDNRIDSWAEVDKFANMPDLDTIYFERNPFYHKDMANYRRKVILALPQIKQLDANNVYK